MVAPERASVRSTEESLPDGVGYDGVDCVCAGVEWAWRGVRETDGRG